VKPGLTLPTFVMDFPVETSPLTREHRSIPGVVEKWDLYVRGFELATGYSELVDPIVQRERFMQQATQAAALPDEEVLKARDAESDKGIEAPSREELSAEEQTELLRVMMERRKQRDRQIARSPTNLAAGELGGEDSSSARGAGSSDDACSDAMSFVTAAGSAVQSRQEKKRQREQRHRQAKGSDYVTLSPEMHAKRLQAAALLKMGRNDLDRVSGEEVDRLHCMLLTQNVGEVRGGYTCLTRLMGTIEMNPETRGGVDGTVIRVTVATQSEVFVPTRDPFELSA
jgi:hypothetical protein